MGRTPTAVVIVVAALIFGGLIYAVSRGTAHSPASPQSASPSASPLVKASPATSPSTSTAPANSSVTVTYDGDTFSPSEATVMAGATITFTNKSSKNVEVDSDPHPVHTSDAELNVGAINTGQSKTVTLTKKGSFGIHNHLNPSQTGHITVQ